MSTELNDYASAVPGHDPVHTVGAIRLLELALTNYDAGLYPVPTVDSLDVVRQGHTAWDVAKRAVADAEVLHDLHPWGPGMAEPRTPEGVDDHVAAVEYAIELLRHRVATRGKRRPVRPL